MDPYQDSVPHNDIYRDAHSDNPSDLTLSKRHTFLLPSNN